MKKSTYPNLYIKLLCVLFIVLFTNCENDVQANSNQTNTNIEKFLNSLDINQRKVINNNPSFITYLQQHNASPQSREFVLQLISIVICNGGSFTFDNGVTTNNALVFWDVSNFGQFLNTINQNGTEFVWEQNQLHTTAKFKVHLLGLFGGIAFCIKQNNMPYSILGISSETYGFRTALNWQQMACHHTIGAEIVTAMVFGKISYNCVLKGNGMVWTTIKIYRIRIDKNTGSIISATKIN